MNVFAYVFMYACIDLLQYLCFRVKNSLCQFAIFGGGCLDEMTEHVLEILFIQAIHATGSEDISQ